MTSREFLLVHGLDGSGPEHWQTWLAERLQSEGENVRLPRLPAPDRPDLDRWLEVLNTELEGMEGQRIVICHSLGAVLWLHYAEQQALHSVDRLLLVAPPGPKAISAIPEISGFLPIPVEAHNVHDSASAIRLVCTDRDKYCEERAAEYYGEPLELSTDRLPPRAGHINTESGFGSWPTVYQWCSDSEVTFG